MVPRSIRWHWLERINVPSRILQKLTKFQMGSLTLHSGKTTPLWDFIEALCVVCIPSPLQPPLASAPPQWTGQGEPRWTPSRPHPISSQRHSSLSVCATAASVSEHTQPPAQHWGWRERRPGAAPHQWGTGLHDSHPQGDFREHLCASQEIPAALSSLCPQKNPLGSAPILLLFFPYHILPVLSLLGSSPK